MTGNNEIILCAAQMQAAVEHYLNTEVFNAKHQVSVKKIETGGTYSNEFRIAIEPKAEQAAGGS